MKNTNDRQRWRFKIQGAVQGVGFRPFIYRIACENSLHGWVNNSSEGVTVEVEGKKPFLKKFEKDIVEKLPSVARVDFLEKYIVELKSEEGFKITPSVDGKKTALILPDLGICKACLEELFDPDNRRYRYPFINCTHCGPRFSIIQGLPYDRPKTTMREFKMCKECKAEYTNPVDRRFHAQPNACAKCGPHIELWLPNGNSIAKYDEALKRAVKVLQDGRILAVKGLGGFHLIVDAKNEKAVKKLRERKRRKSKPLAVMYPSFDAIGDVCRVGGKEREVLLSYRAPIVLLEKNESDYDLSSSVAPGHPTLGVMLPYTPLHMLLTNDFGGPVVATSGNISDEPICIDEKEAIKRLSEIADFFLVHNRPIARPIDDSVVRVIDGEVSVMRRARGYAPEPIRLPENVSPMLAVGGHLKNTVAFAHESSLFISQHIGDLETPEALESFSEIIGQFSTIYESKPEIIVHDKHPDYPSTLWAKERNLPKMEIQHHGAHVLSCMLENGLDSNVTGIAWDGTGYGNDGIIWGGEGFDVSENGTIKHIYSIKSFALPGGEKAIKEPRRCALGLLYEMGNVLNYDIKSHFTDVEYELLMKMLEKGLQSPRCSSIGRLYDAVAAILGICQIHGYEGEAAMMLEFEALRAVDCGVNKEIPVCEVFNKERNCVEIQWDILVDYLIKNRKKRSIEELAFVFQDWLADVILHIAVMNKKEKIVLSGGCFQNKLLSELALEKLRKSSFIPYIHRKIPPNDGGIAAGQIAGCMLHRKRSTLCV